MKRRPVSAFSMAFLDIMFCGFGAVVLLVLILNHDTVKARTEAFSDLAAGTGGSGRRGTTGGGT